MTKTSVIKIWKKATIFNMSVQLGVWKKKRTRTENYEETRIGTAKRCNEPAAWNLYGTSTNPLHKISWYTSHYVGIREQQSYSCYTVEQEIADNDYRWYVERQTLFIKPESSVLPNLVSCSLTIFHEWSQWALWECQSKLIWTSSCIYRVYLYMYIIVYLYILIHA